MPGQRQTKNIYFLKKLLILIVLTFGMSHAYGQTLNLENTRWRSQSFWGYGQAGGSEIFTEKTEDPNHNFQFLIEFSKQNFVSTNLTLEQSEVKQIKGKYHVFANNYIQLLIDSVKCIKPNGSCALPYKSYYNQVHKYSYKNDGKIEFQNSGRRDNWIDRIADKYIKSAVNDRVIKAKSDNYYIEWLPVEDKNVKPNLYNVIALVFEVSRNEKVFDIARYTEKYILLHTLYIELPSRKVFEMDIKGKLVEWKP